MKLRNTERHSSFMWGTAGFLVMYLDPADHLHKYPLFWEEIHKQQTFSTICSMFVRTAVYLCVRQKKVMRCTSVSCAK